MSYLSVPGGESVRGLLAALAGGYPNSVSRNSPSRPTLSTRVTRALAPTRAVQRFYGSFGPSPSVGNSASRSTVSPRILRRIFDMSPGSPSSMRTVSLYSNAKSVSPLRAAAMASGPLASAARVGSSIVSSLSGLATAASPWVGTILLALAAAATIAAVAYGIYLVTKTPSSKVVKPTQNSPEKVPISGNELLSFLPPYARSSIHVFKDPAVIRDLKKLFTIS
jgi:hypothetical protein